MTVAGGAILCFNAGSSSLKFAVYGQTPDPERDKGRLAAGAVERIGLSESRLLVSTDGDRSAQTAGDYKDHASAVHAVLDLLERRGLPALGAVGHRLVHGGPEYTAPVRIDARDAARRNWLPARSALTARSRPPARRSTRSAHAGAGRARSRGRAGAG